MTVDGSVTEPGLSNPSGAAEELAGIVVRSLMIPVGGTQVLLPNTTVAEVTDCGQAVPVPGAPEWLLGIVSWRGRSVPLVSFADLIGLRGAKENTRRRLVVCNTLNGNPELPFIGLAASGIPRLLQVDGTMLERAENDEQEEGAVLGYVSMRDEAAVIPDLDALENMLTRLIGRQE